VLTKGEMKNFLEGAFGGKGIPMPGMGGRGF